MQESCLKWVIEGLVDFVRNWVAMKIDLVGVEPVKIGILVNRLGMLDWMLS